VSEMVINLLIQIIAGAIGGNAVGTAPRDVSPGNTTAGAIAVQAVKFSPR
jgi:hypothetical protein